MFIHVGPESPGGAGGVGGGMAAPGRGAPGGAQASGSGEVPSSLRDLAERERRRRRAALRAQQEDGQEEGAARGGGGGRGGWEARREGRGGAGKGPRRGSRRGGGFPESLALMRPDWMAVPPADLSSEWLVAARPEGRRCVVLARGGRTVARDSRSGKTVASFASSLPGGGLLAGGKGQQCALDCVLQEAAPGEDAPMAGGQAPELKFWVLDVLFWGDLAMVDCEAEMRVFWAACKVEEVGSGAEQFRPVVYAPAEGGNIRQAYRGTGVPYVRDGLLFLHREGHYFGGRGGKGSLSFPLALLWKDASCSRFSISTDAQGEVPTFQRVVLRKVHSDKAPALAGTSDEPAILLARVPESERDEIPAGALLNYILAPAEPAGGKRPREGGGAAGLGEACGQVFGQNVVFQGRAGQGRTEADAFSEVAFQQHLRSGDPLTIQKLLQVAMQGLPGARDENNQL